MSLSGLLVIDDTLVGGKDEEAVLSGRQNTVAELLEVLQFEIESGGDDTTLVKSTVEVDNDLAISLVINDLEFINVAVLLHDSKELDNDLGDGSEHNLKC